MQAELIKILKEANGEKDKVIGRFTSEIVDLSNKVHKLEEEIQMLKAKLCLWNTCSGGKTCGGGNDKV